MSVSGSQKKSKFQPSNHTSRKMSNNIFYGQPAAISFRGQIIRVYARHTLLTKKRKSDVKMQRSPVAKGDTSHEVSATAHTCDFHESSNLKSRLDVASSMLPVFLLYRTVLTTRCRKRRTRRTGRRAGAEHSVDTNP